MYKRQNEDIDNESAYELLNAKIEKAEAEEAKEKAKKEQEKLNKPRSSRSRRSSSTSSATGKAVVKVLTSATFIRGALGILGKFLK